MRRRGTAAQIWVMPGGIWLPTASSCPRQNLPVDEQDNFPYNCSSWQELQLLMTVPAVRVEREENSHFPTAAALQPVPAGGAAVASPLSFGMAAASREQTLGCSTLENAQSWCTWPVPAPWLLNPSTVLRHKDTAPQGTPLRCDPFPIPPCCILPPRFITASISGPACYKRDDPDNTRGQAWAARAEEEKCEAKSFPGKLEGAESGPRGSGMRAERDLPSQPHLTRQNHGPETGGTCRDVFIEGTKSTVATSGQPDRRVWFGGRHRWPQDGSGRELFGRKLCPSLAGAAAWLGWPSAHAASPQLGVMPAPGDATRVGGMRDRHPRNATGAGNHRSSWRGAW